MNGPRAPRSKMAQSHRARRTPPGQKFFILSSKSALWRYVRLISKAE
jgi:hypothetical protein